MVTVQAELGTSLASLAEAYARRNQPDEAAGLLDRSRQLHARLADRFPENMTHKADLARSQFQTGLVQSTRGQRAEARQAYDAARSLWEELNKAVPTHTDFRLELAGTLHHLGLEWARVGEPDRGLDLLQSAIGHCRELYEKSRLSSRYRDALAQRYAGVTEIELQRGRAAEALAAIRERPRLQPFDPEQLYAVARDAVLAAGLANTPDDIRKECARLAVTTLSQAVTFGFSDADRIEKAKAFDAVRTESGFERQLERMRKAR